MVPLLLSGKKLFVFWIIISFYLNLVVLPAYAGEDAPPFPVAGTFSRKLQKYTGVTALTAVASNLLLNAGLRIKMGSGIKAKVGIYSATDLLSGKIRNLEIRMTGARYKNARLGDFSLASVNPIWCRLRRHGDIPSGLAQPVMFKISGRISALNVASGLASPAIASNLRSVKLDLPGLGGQCLQFLDPKVTIPSDNIEISSTLVTAGAPASTGVPIKLTGRPELINRSRIFIRDLQVDSPDIPNPKEFAAFTANLLNPIVDFARMDRQTHAFRLDDLKISAGQVIFNGNLLLAPKVVNPAIAQSSTRK